MACIIDGKQISANIRKKLKIEVANLKAEHGIIPSLAVVIIGDDPASRVYVNNKKRACDEIGIVSHEFALPCDVSQAELLSLIDELNHRADINGILVQMPLPAHISENAVIERISPIKDVDAFHEINVGKLMTGNFKFLPCTPAGIVRLLDESSIDIAGKHCVIIGRSNIVGKPLAMLMLHRDATVTICHSKTLNLAEICRTADILVSAVGRANFVTADMVAPGAAVIDVGINRGVDGKIRGDVDFDNVKEIASYITPVPGGVGPMTICMLMHNAVTAALIQNNDSKC